MRLHLSCVSNSIGACTGWKTACITNYENNGLTLLWIMTMCVIGFDGLS